MSRDVCDYDAMSSCFHECDPCGPDKPVSEQETARQVLEAALVSDEGAGYEEYAAALAEAEALNATSICIFCGETMDKDLTVMLEHAKGCEKRPENELMRRLAAAETESERLRTALVAIQSTTPGSAHRIAVQALTERCDA